MASIHKETSSFMGCNLKTPAADKLFTSCNGTLLAFFESFEVMVRRNLTTDQGVDVIRALEDALKYAHNIKGRQDRDANGYVLLKDHFTAPGER